MSLQTKILNALRLAKESNSGISTDDLAEKLKITKAKLYQAIFRLRANKVKIEQKDDLYLLIEIPEGYQEVRTYRSATHNKPDPKPGTKRPYNRAPAADESSNTSFSMKLMQKEIGTLPEEDRPHYATYMKKATFYRNCALELLKGNKMMETLSPVSLE